MGTAGAFIFVPMLLGKESSEDGSSYGSDSYSDSLSMSGSSTNISTGSSYSDALWVSTFLCLASFWCSLGYFYLAQRARDIIGHEALVMYNSGQTTTDQEVPLLRNDENDKSQENTTIEDTENGGEDTFELWHHVKEVRRFPVTFWMACLQSTLFYGSIFPFGVVAT